MLSSPRRPSSTILILSSAEKCRRVARRMSFTTASAGFLVGLVADFGLEGLGLIFVPYVTATRPNPSIIRNPKSVPKALMPNNHRAFGIAPSAHDDHG